MSVEVSPIEARIIKHIRAGVRQIDLHRRVRISRSDFLELIRRLQDKGLVKRLKSNEFCATDVPFVVVKPPIGESVESAKRVHPKFDVKVTREMRRKIRLAYERGEYVVRSKLSRELGIPRYLLNLEVMNMGLESRPLSTDSDYQHQEGYA